MTDLAPIPTLSWQTKTCIIGSILLILFVMGFIIKIQYDAIQKLKNIETSVLAQKDIGDGILRAQSSYVSKADLENAIKAQGLNLDAIRNDLKGLGANISALNITQVITPGYIGGNIPSNPTPGPANPNPPPPNTPILDTYGYFAHTQTMDINEPFGKELNVPFGQSGFSAWQKDPWSINVYPRTYSETTVLGQDQEGKNYAYSKFTIEVNGKTYTVPITNAKIETEYPSPQFYFNPKLYLSVDGGAVLTPPAHVELMPSVGLSFFSYGKTKLTPEWSFLTLGIGYATQTKNAVINLAPVNYNFGKLIPFMSNFQIGPSISLDTKGNIGLYIGVRVGF